MRLIDLKKEVFHRLQFGANPPPDVQSRVLAELNQTYREILGRKSLSRLRRSVQTFASVADTPFAVLPQAAVRVRSVQDRTRNTLLREISLPDLRAGDPGLSFTTGYPWGYAVYDTAAAVALDPTAAAALYVVSTSASDNSGVTAYIEGITSDGMYRLANVSLNGVTPANLDSNVSTWLTVRKFYLSDRPAGTVTLTQGSGGTELSRIVPGRTYARYTRIHFYGVPSSVNTYYADVDLHVEDMVQDQDEPLLPEDFHWLLPSGAIQLEYLRKEKRDLFGIEAARFGHGLANLQVFIEAPQMSTSRRPAEFSQLGPMYPKGT